MSIDKKLDILRMLVQGFSLYYKVNRSNSARTVARLTKAGEKDIPVVCALVESMRVNELLLDADLEGKQRLNPKRFFRCIKCGFPAEIPKHFSETGIEKFVCKGCGIRFNLGLVEYGDKTTCPILVAG